MVAFTTTGLQPVRDLYPIYRRLVATQAIHSARGVSTAASAHVPNRIATAGFEPATFGL